MRLVLNLIAFIVEIALIVALAWLGANEPRYFAAMTALCALVAGTTLEFSRFAHEMPYYFGRELTGVRRGLAVVWTSSEALIKAVVAGLIALLTFSGTDMERLQWTAILFAVVVFIGTTALLRVALDWGRGAVRWGYFRLAVPLGILFSAGLYGLGQAGLIKTATFSGIAYTATFNLASRPTLEEASEFLFQLSQATDNLIGTLLGFVIPAAYVPLVQIVVSTNVLPGFAIAVLTVTIVRVVHAIQDLGR